MPRAVYALKREGTGDRVSVPVRKKRIVYPDSDGKPMADNTKQFNWIVRIKVGLEVLFADRADVFVAGDLLWYPVEGDNKIRMAPDALVVFGRPKGDRGSYRQWEEGGTAPHTVFEILSPGNTKREMAHKLSFYEKYGVKEYYEYDPDRIVLKGWVRSGNRLEPIGNMQGWVSPGLGIRFEPDADDLHIFRPDGREILRPEEAEGRAEKAEKRAEKAEREKKQAEREKKQAEARAEKERQCAEMLSAKLRELGINLTPGI
ncbi:MAG: Uma2 family endonuclease [Desulfococcaceae bacterium]